MAIISISLPERTLTEIDWLRERTERTGRSDLIRTAIRNFVVEKQQETILAKEGIFTASITIIAPETGKDALHKVQHRHERIIRTQLHQCVSESRCMHLLVVEGKGKEIRLLIKDLENVPRVETVKMVLAG